MHGDLPGEVTKQPVKVGRSKVGVLYTYPDGRKAFIAERGLRDIYKAKFAFVSHAMEQEQAMLSLETITISRLSRLKVDAVGFRMRETGDIYLARFADFKRDGRVVSRRTRLGSPLLSLPIQRFRKRVGKTKFRFTPRKNSV